MLFKFWVRSDMTEDFVLNIDADATHTLYQLHELLQEECKFDPSQLVRFFIADEEWDKGSEIMMFEDSSREKSAPIRLMKNTRLNEILKSEEDKLLYTFDILNDKSLYIELFEIKMEQTIATPTIKLHKGTAPLQEKNDKNEYFNGTQINEEIQHIFDDLGELEDLYKIYGEMSNSIL